MIEKISFKERGRITVYMDDDRIIILPLNHFPSLKKLPPDKRKKYTLLIDPETKNMRGVMFAREILFEIKDFLAGKEIFA
ncbi:MAG: hypothetical protein HY841_05935 [Bacteroidetes bacterium]|nr:hypothetical protein [Bacteroidota bacterium]